mgnify:CR=1 FL=1
MATASKMSTREKLLTAAERIVVERGLTGLSVRKVGQEAQVNPTLVTYHFKSIGNLLEELCRSNLEPLIAQWNAIALDRGCGEDIEPLLRAWLEPMLMPAAFTEDGRALVVLDEIAAHGEGAIRLKVIEAMTGFITRFREAIAPEFPHLDDDELRARLRFISGAVLGPPPRSHGALVTESGKHLDDIEYLVRFAKAALES